MSARLTVDQVHALAPDASALAAATKLARPTPWQGLGQSERALWGECRGSAVYQTQVALADLTSKCTCPSRKLPCKHALALLLLAVHAARSFGDGPEPTWVASFHEKRQAAQEKKLTRAQTRADEPVDAVGQARRADKRHANILAGLAQLDGWMSDLVRQGLARVQREPPSFWDGQARRLVDAQAPGLATRVRQLGARVGAGEQWAARLLDDLGQLALLTHAYRRLEQLPAGLAADVRRLVGLTLEQAEVVAHGDLVDDEWHVLADAVDDEERVRVQRAWLRGRDSGRTALVLQYAARSAGFEEPLIAGTKLGARLAFWPSGAPQRALVLERRGALEPLSALPAHESMATGLDRFAQLLAGCPWLDATLLVLAAAPDLGEVPALVEPGGASLPLCGGDHTLLLALSGGHPLTLTGEWDGYRFVPCCAFHDDGMTRLGAEP